MKHTWMLLAILAGGCSFTGEKKPVDLHVSGNGNGHGPEAQSSKTVATFLGQIQSPSVVVQNPTGGWVTAGQGQSPIIEKSIIKWASVNSIASTVQLDWAGFRCSLDSAFQGIVGGRYIIGAYSSFGEGARVAEFDMATGQRLEEIVVGDGTTRNGAGAMLNNGGFGGVFFGDPSPQNFIRLDAFYRRPPMPPPMPPGTNPPAWTFQRLEFPSNQGTAALRYLAAAVQGQDGLLWIFYSRDSAGEIGLARFRVASNGLELVDHDQAFIGRLHGDASCSHEHPVLSAVVDHYNNRILLTYQTASGIRSPCPDRPNTSYWTITEVKYDKAFRSLGRTSWIAPHIDFPRPVLFPRPDGVYFALNFQNHSTDCALGWHLGRFANGQFEVMNDFGHGKAIGFSQDGWLVFYDRSRSPRETDILKLRFPPQVSISKSGGNAIVNWDEAEQTDILEASTDLQAWSQPYPSRFPPVTTPLTGGQRFFRVRRQ